MIDNQIVASKRIFGLDFLRSLSILLVLFSHISWIYHSEGFIGKMQDFSGFVGIELFLILSGFLVGSIIYKQFITQKYSFKEVTTFLKRRLFRILPSYYLVLLINILLGLVFGFSLIHAWKYFLLLQNFSTPVPTLFPESWSLPIKELSYILVVVLLFICSKWIKQDFRKVFFVSVIYGFLLLSIFFKIIYHIESTDFSLEKWTVQIRSVVIYRMDSVMFGILLGYYYLQKNEYIMKMKTVFLGFGILFFVLFVLGILFCNLNHVAFFWNIVALPYFSINVLLFFPIILSWKNSSNRVNKFILLCCNLSYSIYLIHYSIVLFLMKYFIDTTDFSWVQLHIFTLAYLLITFTLSYFFYTYFEKPINQFRLSNFKLNGKKSIGK